MYEDRTQKYDPKAHEKHPVCRPYLTKNKSSVSEQEEHHVKNEDEIDESHKLQLNKLVSVASELWGQGHGDIVAYPPSSGLVSPVPPKSKIRLVEILSKRL